MEKAVWLFGYGSLIWRPDFDFIESRKAALDNWSRRFWQGSHDHRGTPDAPGRVVTLVPDPGARCWGMAFLIHNRHHEDTFAHLDHREKNGYERRNVELKFECGEPTRGVVYVAEVNNFAWLGPAPADQQAAQISRSVGPSGSNRDYLLELATALRKMDIQDDHIFELERLVIQSPPPEPQAKPHD